MNGLALVQCIRTNKSTRHMPIVMITSRDDHQSLKRALEAGATSYLTKPVNWSLFSDHVEHLIRMGQQSESTAKENVGLDRVTRATAAVLESIHGELRTKPRDLTRLARALPGADTPEVEALLAEVEAQRSSALRLAKWASIAARASKDIHTLVSLRHSLEAQVAQRAGARTRLSFSRGTGSLGLFGNKEALEYLAVCLVDLVLAANKDVAMDVAMAFEEDGILCSCSVRRTRRCPTAGNWRAERAARQQVGHATRSGHH